MGKRLSLALSALLLSSVFSLAIFRAARQLTERLEEATLGKRVGKTNYLARMLYGI